LHNVKERSIQFFEALNQMQHHYPEIGDVRGKGLMIGVEIVNPQKPMDRLGHYPPDGRLAATIQKKCFEHGLLIEVGGRKGAVLRFLPPLIINKTETEKVLDIFATSVQQAVAWHA